MKKTCIQNIKNKYESLTRIEKKIASYVMNNPSEVVTMSVKELALKAQVAPSAVIRCCKSLGFCGFPDFKLSLAVEISSEKQLNYAPYISPVDDSESILKKVFSSNVKTLHDTAEKINYENINRAVEMILAAHNVYIFAVGTSAGLAVDFQYRLMQFGFCAFCVTDVPTMKIATLNMNEKDVAFGISHSGRTVSTIEALLLAKKRGSKTICLTSYPDSIIANKSDCPICICSDEIEYPAEAVSARIGHMSVLDSIAISLSAKNYEETLKRSKENRKLIDTIRYES